MERPSEKKGRVISPLLTELENLFCIPRYKDFTPTGLAVDGPGLD